MSFSLGGRQRKDVVKVERILEALFVGDEARQPRLLVRDLVRQRGRIASTKPGLLRTGRRMQLRRSPGQRCVRKKKVRMWGSSSGDTYFSS